MCWQSSQLLRCKILNINRFTARYHLANPDHVRISAQISGFSECADEWELLPIEAVMVILHQKLEPETIHSEWFWAKNLAKIGSGFLRKKLWYKTFSAKLVFFGQLSKNILWYILHNSLLIIIPCTDDGDHWKISDFNFEWPGWVSVFWRLGPSSK